MGHGRKPERTGRHSRKFDGHIAATEELNGVYPLGFFCRRKNYV
jgi:hypothetical protein